MEIGTAETAPLEDERSTARSELKRRAGSSGGDNQNRGGGGGGGGDNGGKNKPEHDFQEETDNYANKFRIGMWFILLVVLMTFGGLIAAYIVLATNAAMEWSPFELPAPVWVSTVLLLSSSITFQLSNRALIKENQERAKNLLLATTCLGGMFISSQILAWVALVREGVYMASNPYAGFFYILTAVHALHVLGGIITLGYIVLRSWEPTRNSEELKKRQTFSNVTGWYWHFMDGLWIVLLVMLGFWK